MKNLNKFKEELFNDYFSDLNDTICIPFNLAGRFDTNVSGFDSDKESLMSDWKKIGEDFKKII
jgi:hypothetical protein